MATRVDLPLKLTWACLNQKLASVKRANTSATNELIAEALRSEAAQIQTAMNTMTEIK